MKKLSQMKRIQFFLKTFLSKIKIFFDSTISKNFSQIFIH